MSEILTLGQLLEHNITTGERALKQILLKEGISYDPGRFMLAWAKETDEGAELISFYPDLSSNPALWIGRDLIVNTKSSKILKVESFQEDLREEIIDIPTSMMLSSDKVKVKVRYKKAIIKGKITQKFESGSSEVSFLFANPEVTYMNFVWAQNLYYHLGFPLKKFDNLGNFWKNGLLYDLTTTAYKKIA